MLYNFGMRKILIGIGALVAIIVLIAIFRSFNKDEVAPKLTEIVINHQVIKAASSDASAKTTSFSLQTDAANIATVITSNQSQLGEYYRQEVDKKLPTAGATSLSEVTKLEESPSGPAYDEAYLKLIKQELQANLDALQAVYDLSKSSKLRELTSQLYKEQAALLNQL